MTEKYNIKNDAFTFDVDAQLITELGERLVSRNHIGISELIKNAYDADSPDVDVSLFGVLNSPLTDSELVISDTGLGMTFETVEKNWMTIGTSNKRSNPFSKRYGRPVTGNKGIGRFACQRLAEQLELTTCAKINDGFEHTTVHFDWDDFIPGKLLSTVRCQYQTYKSDTGAEGTTLRLKSLRERVTERDFKMILKSITLISIATPAKRDGYKEDPGFKTSITAPEFQGLIGRSNFKVDEELLASGWGTVSGNIDSAGLVSFKLDCKDTEQQTYSCINDNFKSLGGISFRIHVIPLKIRDGIESRRRPTFLTSEVINNITQTHSGIKLYLNGFRVYPYGEVNEGDDWLGIAHDISKRRGPSDFPELQELAAYMGIAAPNRAMLNHPGTRSLIGNVVIEGPAINAFQVKMDREGLVADDNFNSLKQVIRMCLDWTTINYEVWLHRKRQKKHEIVTQQFEQSIGNKYESTESRITKAINTLWSEDELNMDSFSQNEDILEANVFSISGVDATTIHNEQPATDTASENPVLSQAFHSPLSAEDSKIISKEAKAQKNTARAYLISETKELESELEMLRALSATAPLLFVFAHEVNGIAQALTSQSAQLKLISEKINDPTIQKQLNNLAETADIYKKSFDDLLELFDVFSDSTNKISKTITYKNLFGRIQAGFKFFLKNYDIELIFEDVRATIAVPKLNPAEAYSVFINLISNSIKSLIASNNSHRVINVSVYQENEIHYILVKDNGIGLKKEYWQRVFEPRVFDPEGKLYSSVSSKLGSEKISNLGKGSGLGLNIVRSILKKHKGSINFIDPSPSWSAEVQIIIGK